MLACITGRNTASHLRNASVQKSPVYDTGESPGEGINFILARESLTLPASLTEDAFQKPKLRSKGFFEIFTFIKVKMAAPEPE